MAHAYDMIADMKLQWYRLSEEGGWLTATYRAKVPGGWLVQVVQKGGCGITFYFDPKHEWNGASLP